MKKRILFICVFVSSISLFGQSQELLFNRFVEAVNDQKTEEALSVINQGMDPNYDTSNSSQKIYEYVCNKGYMVYRSKVNSSSSYPPLFFALMARNTVVVEALLKKGANGNAIFSVNRFGFIQTFVQSEYQNKSIICLSYQGKRKTLDLLLAHGANINHQNAMKRSALHYVAMKNQKELMELLLQNGADATLVNSDGSTAFDSAIGENSIDVIKYLIELKYDINKPNRYGVSPLLHALKNKNVEIAKLLIAKGASLNADNIGGTVLHYATLGGSSEMIKFFVDEKGFKANVVDEDGQTPLHYILDLYYTSYLDSTISILLKCGADINQKDKKGNTPLLLAVLDDNKYVVRSLVKYGANLDLANLDADFPLQKSFKCRENEITQLLLDKGANVKAKYRKNYTLLHAIAYGSKDNKKVFIDTLIAKGVDVNAINDYGATPLHKAVEIRDKEIVEILLRNGANINVVDDGIGSPLHLASTMGELEMVQFLIANGANINLKNKDGKTPVECTRFHKNVKEYLFSIL